MATQDQKTDTKTQELNAQALALAEQLGRIAGTLEGTAESWLNRASVADQLTKVRDGATQLLNSLTGAVTTGRKTVQAQAAKARPRAAAADPAHAPGKKHRKPAPTVHGAKHSDSRIPKAKASEAARRRRKSST